MKQNHATLLSAVLFFSITASLQSQTIKEVDYLDRPHFEVSTSSATYLFDARGGGFSSIKDKDGNEWIGFKPGDGSYPASAAASFRGLPNLVYQGDDNGSGHPGFDNCTSKIILPNQILTVSNSDMWEWMWTFSEKGAMLEINRTDTTRNYWFLYEGIPGGEFDPKNQYWGNNADGYRTDTPQFGSEKTRKGAWDWAYFGHQSLKNCLFVLHLTPDNHTDVFSYLGNSGKGMKSEDGMVVFGLGRDEGNPLMKGPNSFFIGFFDHIGSDGQLHGKLEDHIEMIRKSQ